MVKLFSIKREFCEKIYSREKIVEFRRQNINIRRNERCLIYTSHPVKKITGTFVVKDKIRLPLKKLWEKTKQISGLTKSQFLNYFEGCKYGTAILFKSVRRFISGLAYEDMRKLDGGFRAPQSYCNIQEQLAVIMLRKLGYKVPSLTEF